MQLNLKCNYTSQTEFGLVINRPEKCNYMTKQIWLNWKKFRSKKIGLPPHSEKSISDSIQIERNAIIMETVLLLIMNQTKCRLDHNQNENKHYDDIPFGPVPVNDKPVFLSLFKILNNHVSKTKNSNIDFSFVSEHWATFWTKNSIWSPLMGERGGSAYR